MDKNLALDFVRVTEKAAIASARFLGRGDKNIADEAATEEMRKNFNDLDMKGRIVIGEGERDEAPMLFIGEEVGKGSGDELDIAVDPLECTNSVAYGRPNAIAVMASAPKGSMLHAPDVYMNKIAVGPEAKGKIDLDASVSDNLGAVASAKGMDVKDLMVVMLERDYNAKLIEEVRKEGARLTLIADGDVSAGVSTCLDDSDVDVLLGHGAAPEGVITASAIKCLGGEMQGRLVFDIGELKNKDTDKLKEKAIEMGVADLEKKMTQDDLVKGDDCMFIATGVSTGSFLKGVDFTTYGAKTFSMSMRAQGKTIRYVETKHYNV
ncbi:MAG: class II fructose-bisphosphatase [Parcubacteria group bacterium]|nr:class II fructose-bisphosphatase [Parcubacteria group bacterium]